MINRGGRILSQLKQCSNKKDRLIESVCIFLVRVEAYSTVVVFSVAAS